MSATIDETESLKKLFNPDSKEWLQSPNENNSLLEEWLSTPMTEAKITTAAPIIATTITLEAIHSLLYSNGYGIGDCKTDLGFGPFEDTQFDVVVDVETSSTQEKVQDIMQKEAGDNSLCGLSEESFPDCSDLSDLSEDDLTILPDMVISDSDLELSCDSGIEAEIDDLHETKTSERKCKSERIEKRRKRTYTETSEDCKTQDQKNKKPCKKTNLQKEEENEELRKPNCQFLWEFLHYLLVSKQYEECIAWKNPHKGVFRMVDHNMVAKLWGKHKKRKNMTYDKLSRALRYYYAKNILAKVNGQRLTYKFCRDPNGNKYPS